MKAFIERNIPTNIEDLNRYTNSDLIRFRFFVLKGFVNKELQHTKKTIEKILYERATYGDFSLDDLSHLVNCFTKKGMLKSKDRRENLGPYILGCYNAALRFLVSHEDPQRYRYVVYEYLDEVNQTMEFWAWLNGNSHFIIHNHRLFKQIITQFTDEEMYEISKRLVDIKSALSVYLLDRNDLDPELRKRILKCDFISPFELARTNTVFDKDFLNGLINSKKKLEVIESIVATAVHHPKVVNIQFSKEDVKQTLFPFIDMHTKEIERINVLMNDYKHRKGK